MTIENIALTGLLSSITGLLGLLLGASKFHLKSELGREANRTNKEAKLVSERALYLRITDIVKEHHSKEKIRDRGDLYAAFRRVLKSKNPKLIMNKFFEHEEQPIIAEDFTPEEIRLISSVANYYEYLGIMVVSGKEKFGKKDYHMLLSMLHNSTSKVFNLIRPYKDELTNQNTRPSDWGENFNKLHKEVVKYRECNPKLVEDEQYYFSLSDLQDRRFFTF